MLEEIKREFEANPYCFISSFQGLTVADYSDLRRGLEKVSNRSLVVKHALVRKVFSSLNLTEAEKFLKGSVIVTFADKEPQLISKTVFDFAKTNQKFSPVGVVLDHKVYDESYIKQLAKLPSRQELLAQVVTRINSPITGLVLTLGQLIRGLAVALNEVKKKKETAA